MTQRETARDRKSYNRIFYFGDGLKHIYLASIKYHKIIITVGNFMVPFFVVFTVSFHTMKNKPT